ncbi:MAG: glycoside hydrolase family 18 protein [Steroidobacteraceae bacterium]
MEHPVSCPNAARASAGNFAAFARLTNKSQTLKRIISIGGGDSQKYLDNAFAHPEAFIQSAATVIRAYHLDGIDLDFEPDAFFPLHQGEQYAQLVAGLRKELGDGAFISIEVPADWETLRSIDCPADTRCSNNLGHIAANAFVSLMGYEFHEPAYPGDVTGNNSNLYSDPDEPLVPRFYHVSDNQAVEYLTRRDVPTSKILLGFPAYFIAYNGVGSGGGSNGLYQPFDKTKSVVFDLGTSKGRGTDRAVQKVLKSGFSLHYVRVNGKISAAYAYSKSGQQWISYENPTSLKAKAQYVLARHLAGMMMWEIGEDVPADDAHSLLRSAHAALGVGGGRLHQ